MVKKRINIIDFSAMLGVSTATVSRAFSNKGRISKNTKEMILAKAIEFGYSPNINAQNLILKQNNTIAFFYPALIEGEPDFFISEVMLGINESLLQSNKVLQIFPFSNKNEANLEVYRRMILNGSLSGLIIIGGSSIGDKLIKIAKDRMVPSIVIDPENRFEKNSVSFRLEYGAEQVGEYFKDSGKKQIMYIRGLNDKDKLKGFRKGLGSLADSLIVDPGGSTFLDGSTVFQRMKKSDLSVDAVFCANDILAIGFMKEAISNNVRIPQDISVVGCDDVAISKFYSPALSTIFLNIYKIGEKSVELLNKLIKDESDVSCEIIPTKLIIRESS